MGLNIGPKGQISRSLLLKVERFEITIVLIRSFEKNRTYYGIASVSVRPSVNNWF